MILLQECFTSIHIMNHRIMHILCLTVISCPLGSQRHILCRHRKCIARHFCILRSPSIKSIACALWFLIDGHDLSHCSSLLCRQIGYIHRPRYKADPIRLHLCIIYCLISGIYRHKCTDYRRPSIEFISIRTVCILRWRRAVITGTGAICDSRICFQYGAIPIQPSDGIRSFRIF